MNGILVSFIYKDLFKTNIANFEIQSTSQGKTYVKHKCLHTFLKTYFLSVGYLTYGKKYDKGLIFFRKYISYSVLFMLISYGFIIS